MTELVAPALGAAPLARYGYPEYKTGASPAVATDFSQTLAGGMFVRLLSVFCRLVPDANAASREVVLQYLDGQGNVFDVTGSSTTVAASTTRDYSFSAFQGPTGITADSTLLVPLHPYILPPTFSFKLHVVSVQAGDQLSRIRWLQESFYVIGEPPGPDAL